MGESAKGEEAVSKGIVLTDGIIITLIDNRVVRGSVRIDQGIITAVDRECEIRPGDQVIALNGAVVTPALVNAHLHLGETFLRGLVDGLNLEQYIAVSHGVFDTDELRGRGDHTHVVSSWQTIRECIRSGTGTVCASRGWGQVQRSGLRGLLGYPLVHTPKLAAYHDQLKQGFGLLRERVTSSRVTPCLFVQCVDNVSRDVLDEVARLLAEDSDLRMFVHMAESPGEGERSRQRGFRSPIAELAALGLLTERTILVHCVYVDDEDADVIADSGAAVVLCPIANLRLGGRLPDFGLFLSRDIRVAVGTDGLAVGGSAALLESARFSVIVGRRWGVDEGLALTMITRNAALALGMDTGEIAAGRPADICVWEAQGEGPVVGSNPVSDLIHNWSAITPRHLLVDGKFVLRDGKVVTFDERAVGERFSRLAREVAAIVRR